MSKLMARVMLALAFLGCAAGAQTPETSLHPFQARYQVKYGSLTVGDSLLELRRDTVPGQWVLETRADARGLARLLASETLVQTSWLAVEDGHARPLRFRFDDGMERSNEDISLDFDWDAGRVRGNAKGEAVDLEISADAQDPVSNQLAAMVALLAGRPPDAYSMFDNPKRGKAYEYEFLRKERVQTEAGSFDALVYSNFRPGSDRTTHLWLAPSLQYLAVQIESYRKGKRGFSMYLKKYTPGK